MRTEFGSVNCWTEVRNRGQIVFKSGMKTDVGTWVYWEKGFRMWKTSLLKIIEWFLVYVKHLLEIILTSECYFSTYCQVNLLITQFHLFIDGCCSFIFNVLGIHKWCFFFLFWPHASPCLWVPSSVLALFLHSIRTVMDNGPGCSTLWTVRARMMRIFS